MQQQSGQGGVVLFFDFKVDLFEVVCVVVFYVIDSICVLFIVINFGDMKFIIIYLVMILYGCFIEVQCQVVGIGQGLICLFVGFEYVDDIIDDLLCGFFILMI